MERSAKARKLGQFGPVVWPPPCWLLAPPRRDLIPSASVMSRWSCCVESCTKAAPLGFASCATAGVASAPDRATASVTLGMGAISEGGRDTGDVAMPPE